MVEMKRNQYILLVIAVCSVIGYEVYMGSPAWSQTGIVNWVGPIQVFNPDSVNQYFAESYSVFVPNHGVFNFTAYVIPYNGLPTIGGSVTVIRDHYGSVYVR
jgi:hypothetical protein